MKAHLMMVGLLSLGVLLVGCDKAAPPNAAQKSAEAETPEKKLAGLAKRAEQGDASAQSALGQMYYKGEGVPEDTAKAIEWFEKAAAQGHADAQSQLGWIYARGEAVPTDVAKVVEWTQKAAARGDASAQLILGSMYAQGKGVPKDLASALELVQKSAAQGNAEAQFALGDVYSSGIEGLIPKDAAKAVEWFQKAAAQGHERAQKDLARMYEKGEGVTKDVAKAVELWEKAAAQGNVDTQRNLARMYAKGEGVPKNAVKAVEWYQKAAAQGDANAQYNLGAMYYKGEGVPKEAAKEIEWTQKAAAQGDTDAQSKLGWMYESGRGVPKDNVLAYAWLNLYFSRGNFGGINISHFSFAQSMSAVEVAEAQRLSSSWKKGEILVREGRSQGNSPSQSNTPGILSKSATGTLFLVNATGQAITNRHVVAGCGEVRLEGRDGVAKVVTEDAVNDLALVQIPGQANASAAITSEPSKLRQGEDIVVFGFPLNAVLSSGGNLTPGVVSALTGLGNNTNQIQITAPIQPGSSGSPVLNKKGEVVGVVSMKLSDSKMAKATGSVGQNVNFAVNGQTLRTFLDTHKVAYRSGAGFFSLEKSTADLADEARKWTLVVECWK